MKKIIDGKMYNTDTATVIGSWDNGCYVTDFDYCVETLYKTRKGRYFLLGESGARGPYAVGKGNGWWGSGKEIIPMEESEARAWAEEYLDADEFVREFGGVEEA